MLGTRDSGSCSPPLKRQDTDIKLGLSHFWICMICLSVIESSTYDLNIFGVFWEYCINAQKQRIDVSLELLAIVTGTIFSLMNKLVADVVK